MWVGRGGGRWNSREGSPSGRRDWKSHTYIKTPKTKPKCLERNLHVFSRSKDANPSKRIEQNGMTAVETAIVYCSPSKRQANRLQWVGYYVDSAVVCADHREPKFFFESLRHRSIKKSKPASKPATHCRSISPTIATDFPLLQLFP